MTKEDFTEDELKLLRVIFKGADAVIEAMRSSNYDVYDINYDVYDINNLYNIKIKLGIYDLVE